MLKSVFRRPTFFVFPKLSRCDTGISPKTLNQLAVSLACPFHSQTQTLYPTHLHVKRIEAPLPTRVIGIELRPYPPLLPPEESRETDRRRAAYCTKVPHLLSFETRRTTLSATALP